MHEPSTPGATPAGGPPSGGRSWLALLRPAAVATPLPPERIDPEYRRLRRQVFLGIFLGYAGY
jgi:hypothetical protein